ncbi:bifunctional phosphopantothenoylcysteine decarboxylase/phosphopantothenate--cysteine ligase CoaBC [Aliifodinibius salicampi]|uniref:Coenzyme A biosynthesis bifunctional protein CoaBC n=1 Tax=Fodinibius salicampi TaxID=1920655 RepID=A0ABT3PY63_9BACT|nr:bifunctional phosphopantothenoylcysteine decarboxylase/phosphopantothenate--cysteine ligase CoaBC [Fodinibius salicampi]MCW9712800.1 bifunctional phosphopantothenoylcysteine decarboxylase/phosphopantothenate--cysteine ligase CoaBC [Fodinibius salicampi]
MLSGKRIILGVSGGIAAYKAAFLLRAYQKAGAEVRVTMTPDARRFVGAETFASLSKHSVAIDIFSENQTTSNSWTKHIDWGEWADLFVIAPCTANTLGKIAGGLSDNMLTATVMAARCPLLLCPTMDGEMYRSPAVKRNLETLKRDGIHILEPEEGYLASGLEGKGRLPKIENILAKSREIIKENLKEGLLTNKKVVVTAGPTREFIDPVRFISNPSSGKMGVAMARAAQKLGGEVSLIHGPIQVPIPKGLSSTEITSAHDLFEEVKKQADAEVIIMAAAVADFTPADTSDQKVKKDQADTSLSLQKTHDILSWLGKNKQNGQILIGFAMETENLIEQAKKKRARKKIDWILANSIASKESGFATDKNTIIALSEEYQQTFSGDKEIIAEQILNMIFGDKA